MTKEAIFERISFIIKEQMNKPDLEITQTTSLHDDLGVDSIALTEFVINLEDEFHLEIPDEDVEDMKCMGEMMEYLYNRVK
ncbi:MULTISPECIES: acyl carrier protein [Streptococcus]|jgi:acyl carrier protein|uniref:Acyl carrier protein n=3 Tax=Streptococcus TaxID=1301 RepID=A0A6G8HZT8_9STRE|nr:MULTISPECIES: acyl carrier protein [Streptococcus]EQC70993.1 Acyl carrier protein [Streptococcus sp. HSISB1]EFW88082.1 putative acyl carrier protein [Streptococcus equinus ATCC 9812]KEY46910.1 acyl carrier protein [Streptococcus equinus]KFN87231.1 acyl carrier protein [Streptococcus equinus ATCC 33317]MBE6163620.1 acyl carrier protein [Streptococcus equinus]